MAEVLGEISGVWPDEVAEAHIDIWTHNRTFAENVGHDLDLLALGGLVLRFSAETYPEDRAKELGGRRRLVNLAFEEDGRLTLGHSIIEAIKTQKTRDNISAKFVDGAVGPYESAAWLIPVTAIDVIRHITSSRSEPVSN